MLTNKLERKLSKRIHGAGFFLRNQKSLNCSTNYHLLGNAKISVFRREVK